jgi:tetratricopeptide (TPR) repeat protein
MIPDSGNVQSSKSNLELADSLFKTGKFAEAEKFYAEVLAADSQNFHAAFRLGYTALLANRLDEAQKRLSQAIALKPEDSAAQSMLAEAFYRRDDFQQAAPLLRAIGREAMAKKLESFKGVTPYQIESEVDVTSLKFIMTDPIPVVQVRVNDGESVNFFIDTGGAEVFIDTEFAKEIGAMQFGSETGTFAGGQRAGFQYGRVDSIILSNFTIKNVPVHIMDIRRFSEPAFGGMRVDGVIGTVLLYHFLSALDYLNGELILRRSTKEHLHRLEEEAKAKNYIVIPFRMAGDHLMVAWGTVNKSQPLLLFVDTGLAGGGFTCPESTLKEASIELQEQLADDGIGGAGKVHFIPFVVEELTLGDATAYNIQGFTGAFPSSFENAFGFRIGGLISHGFFRQYALTFDFTGMRLFLKMK